MKYWKIGLFIGLILIGRESRAQNMLADITEKTPSLPFRAMAQQILQYGEQLRQPQLPQEKQKLIVDYNTLNGRYKDSIFQYIQTSSNTETASILPLSFFFDIQKDSSFLRKCSDFFQKNNVRNKYTKYIGEELSGMDSAQVGKIIPMFSLLDFNGKTQNFPNGHKTLLVFWASWCVPCRAENDHLKDQYAALQQKGLEIASVNLDEDKNRWLLASKQDQLPWANCFPGNAWESRIARFFTLHQIPQNVLLDGTGKILARNVSLSQLGKE